MSALIHELPSQSEMLIRRWVETARSLDISQRRQHRRFPFFRVACIDDEADQNIEAFTRDISPDGIGLLHCSRKMVGDRAAVSVFLNNRVVKLDVETQWCHSIGRGWYYSGGRFVGLSVRQVGSLLVESVGSELGRRWRHRYPMFRPMSVSTSFGELSGFSFDISLSGMGILLTEPVSPQTVFIRPEDQNAANTTLRATALRCDERPHGWHVLGCEFASLAIDELPSLVY